MNEKYIAYVKEQDELFALVKPYLVQAGIYYKVSDEAPEGYDKMYKRVLELTPLIRIEEQLSGLFIK